MPRRHPSKSNPLKSKGKKDRSIQKWNTRDDIQLDEVDQFHEQRDKILLEGEEAAQDGDYDEGEIFTLKGLDESSEEENEVEEDEDDDEPEETGEPEPPKSPSRKRSRRRDIGTKKSSYYSSNAVRVESEDEDEEAREMEEQEAHKLQ